MEDFQRFYSHALSSQPERQHFAAHSHHLWPDCTREAQLQYWEDSATRADQKWEHVFGNVLADSRAWLASLLGLPEPRTIALAPNTHEFVARIYSCFGPGARVVTTDSEFHSFERQTRRLEEDGAIVVERVPVFPAETFTERFIARVRQSDPDLVFMSEVFFNSGWKVPSVSQIVSEIRALRAEIVVDGYHSFCAVPIRLSEIADRAFFMAGGYKYAQAGEGACFLHVPARAATLRPRNTGWFADFAHLESPVSGPVGYGEMGERFAGATFDPSGWYRFNAVMRWWRSEGITVQKAHEHATALQQLFLAETRASGLEWVENALLLRPEQGIGRFLSLRLPDASARVKALRARNVIVDARGDVLRFGFGLYQNAASVQELVRRMRLLPA